MSYIRCLSNPEGLYIYSDGGGICIHGNFGDDEDFMRVPEKDFHGIGMKYGREYLMGDRPLKFGGITLREVKVVKGTDRIYTPIHHKKMGIHDDTRRWFDKPQTEHKILFSYGGKSFLMWRVTWDYIVRSIQNHVDWDRKEKRKRKRRGNRTAKKSR